jgi:hypothetical protein
MNSENPFGGMGGFPPGMMEQMIFAQMFSQRGGGGGGGRFAGGGGEDGAAIHTRTLLVVGTVTLLTSSRRGRAGGGMRNVFPSSRSRVLAYRCVMSRIPISFLVLYI